MVCVMRVCQVLVAAPVSLDIKVQTVTEVSLLVTCQLGLLPALFPVVCTRYLCSLSHLRTRRGHLLCCRAS